jgi:hypothetical protein
LDPAKKKIDKLINTAYPNECCTRLMLPDEPWAHKLYSPEIYVRTAAMSDVSWTPNCVASARVLLSGSDDICGITFGAVPGDTISEKRHALSQMTVDALDALMQKNAGWCMRMSGDNNECFLVPSGCLILTGGEGSDTLRWGVSSDVADTVRVASNLQAVTESFPDFGHATSTTGQFFQWLRENP